MRALLLVALGWLAAVPDEADDQYAYVAGLAEKGLYDRVVKEAESFLRDHPEHPKCVLARYRLACALFELKREPEAALQFRELARRRGFEFEPEVQFRLGQCELAGGRCEPAATALARAVALATGAAAQAAKKEYLLVPAIALLAEAHFRCERWDAARASWTALLERAPDSEYASDAACGLAWCAFHGKDREAASVGISRWLERQNGHARAGEMRVLLGECQLDLGRPKEALAAYRAVRTGPFAEAALRGAGFALAAQGDHAGAAREFTALLERHPESRFAAECTLHGGIERLLAGDAAGARTLLESPAAGEAAEALYWRARAQAASGAADTALATLDRAAASQPGRELFEQIGIARGDALAALGRTAEAARAWERSGSDYALQAAAIASLHDERPADAVRFARRLLEQHPDSKYRVEAGLALGEGLFAQKDYPQAEKSFAAALAADTDVARRARSRARVAWCRYLLGDHRSAADQFAALARETSEPLVVEEAAFMEARAREALGDKQGAARGYSDYLERHEDGPHADEVVLRIARLFPGPVSSELLVELVRDKPDGPFTDQARFELAERSSALSQWPQARVHYAEVLERHARSPLAPAARYGLAWCDHQAGKPDDVIADLAPLLADTQTSDELRTGALELCVWSQCPRGDADALLATWREFSASTKDEMRLLNAVRPVVLALKKADRVADAHALLAQSGQRARSPEVSAGLAVERAYLWIDQQKLDDAERELALAARAAPASSTVAEGYFQAGEARFAAGQDERASALYEASARNGDSPVADRALYKNGFARLRTGDHAGAERAFAALVERHPKSALVAEGRFLLGEAQYRAERYEEATLSLQRMLADAPRHPVRPKALFRLGLALGKSGRWRESAETLATLMRESPGFENANEAELWRGRALARGNDPRGARAALARVIANDRGELSAHAHLELGRIHAQAGELEPALSEFLKVAVLYADPELVAEGLLEAGRVLEAQGDVVRAQAQYREIVEKHPKTRSAEDARKRLDEIRSR